MKLYKYSAAALLALSLSFSSCNDWMNIDPENTQTTDQYWETGDDVEAVLGSAYYYLRDSWQYMYFWAEARGNGTYVYNESTNDGGKFNKLRRFEILPTDAYVKWEKMYKIISMANSVIKYAPSVSDRDESFSENIMKSTCVEAYWLRAYAYFTLVRNFRDVPLVLEPYVTDEAPVMIAKSSEADVLEQIIQDLEDSREYAKELFPATTNMTSQENSKGRATKWAVDALLADIYLWRGEQSDYLRCVELCDEIINSGRVGLIEGAQWFSNFYPGNSNESIFEIQYNYNLGQTNSFLTVFLTNMTIGLSPASVYQYSATDVRGAGATYFESTSGGIAVNNWKFVGVDKTTTRSTSLQKDQNWIIYRLAEIYLMKAEALIMTEETYDNGIENINIVRRRAGLDDVNVPDQQVEALKLLLTERKLEFVSEGKSWYDLLRIAKRNGFANREIMIDEILEVTGASQTAIVRARLAKDDALYLPIHSDELKANTLLEQNPYYESLGN